MMSKMNAMSSHGCVVHVAGLGGSLMNTAVRRAWLGSGSTQPATARRQLSESDTVLGDNFTLPNPYEQYSRFESA
eukprot:6465448-Amphidinium_carterae.1